MIEETLTRIAVALEAIAAKPPVMIMTAPADGGGQSLVGVETGAPAATPAKATRGPGKKTLNAAEAAKLADANAAIDKEEAEKAARLAALPPLPGTPIGGTVPAEADELVADEAIPDDTTMKQAVIALLSNSKRPLAVAILKEYGVSNASAVPDEHRVTVLAKLKAALAA